MVAENELANPPKKKADSDRIRKATIGDYVHAHSKPNGNGWRGFFRSNLFTALLIWLLSQVVLIVGAIAATYFAIYLRTNQLTEWRNSVELTLKRMDEWGTMHSHYEVERLDRNWKYLDARVDRLEVSEQQKLSKELDELRKNHNNK